MSKTPKELREIIGRNIRYCRKNKYPGRDGAKKCAMRIGVTQQQWSLWEKGHRVPNARHLAGIADLFGENVDYFHRNNEHFQEQQPMEGLAYDHGKYSTGDMRYAEPIPGIDVPPSSTWQPEPPGSPESFYWLARHLTDTIIQRGVTLRIDKEAIRYLASLVMGNDKQV